MLTATYSIMLLKSEQKKARSLVSSLDAFLNGIGQHAPAGTDLRWLQQGFGKLSAAHAFCSKRKVELYLIPAVRNRIAGAHTLLDVLETRSLYCTRILDFVGAQMRGATANARVDLGALTAAMQLYCRQMQEKFKLEEEDLLTLACSMLSESDWFDFASQCLAHTESGTGSRWSEEISPQAKGEHVLVH